MDRPTPSETEQHKVLVEWNQATADYGPGSCLHHLLESQASHRPDHIAVVCGQASLSYGQLNQRANQLARCLRQEKGVQTGALVALCVRRSLDMVVAIAAILKAGGAYLPISPAYPRERIALLLSDSAAKLLITEKALRDQLPEAAGQTLYLDELGDSLRRHPTDNPAYPVAATDLAYSIYTSGSTGRPKGVLVEHRGAYNTAAAHIDLCQLRPDDRVLQFAAFGFDTSILELVMTLGAGATLYLVPQDELQVGDALADLLIKHSITVVALLPSVTATLPERELPALRILISGGEICPTALAERWSRGRTFFNAYGPTEASICATLGRYAPEDGDPAIGRPLPNTRAYILDAEQRPVAIGEPGELYLGGVGVARGYLNRPQLTAEHFLPDPFAPAPGGRMYRTGDRARFRPDGRIDFLGRLDDQVKIRGFRVEPGEVEAALSRQPGVKQCVVLARKDSPGERRLCAYVVPEPGADCTAARLRESLRGVLPDFMMPSAFVLLGELPLTVHGKVDRASLPPPGRARPALAREYVAPVDDIQRIVAATFASALDLDEVGIEDDFFELGGQSLLAAQAAERLARRLSIELPVRVLFQHRTVARLGEYVRSAQPAAGLQPLTRASRALPLPLSSSQEQVWLTSHIDAQSTLYNEPYALTVHGPLDVDSLLAALQAVVDRHEILRTTFEVINGAPTQRIRAHVRLHVSRQDLRVLPESEREEVVKHLHESAARRPFDLQLSPLLRAELVRMSDDEHRLLLTIHHAIFDGVSMNRVFLPELVQLYESGQGGRASLPVAPLQYADYAVWERAQLTPAALAPHIEYWKRQLADLPVVQLPTDHQRAATSSLRGTRYALHLGRELTDGLAALAQREGATL
jgi:amino acid adenylation domain-containing protein